MIELDALNRLPPKEFAEAIGDIFEFSPWVAERTAPRAPFATVEALHDGLMRTVREASDAERMALLRAHPELGGAAARGGDMTPDSVAEQGALGLNRLNAAGTATFDELNGAYRARFSFPFIICVRRHTRGSVLSQFARRLRNDAVAEAAAAIGEIGFISRLRLAAKVTGPGMPPVDGHLSTHVLDTARGRPAAGVALSLHEIGGEGASEILATRTNADGRTDAPLIAGQPLRIGTYELRFEVGAYFAASAAAAEPPFLQTVPIRFAVAEPEGRYHIALLLSPWSYTTYRGS
jgi:2-oxo-4-hydroxy-4-carboxy-5-ureidoimidazoline decarboxylase